jgi:hypothetical protein
LQWTDAGRVLQAKWRCAEHAEQLLSPARHKGSGLIRVNVEDTSSQQPRFALVLAGGRRIEVGSQFTEVELMQLIRPSPFLERTIRDAEAVTPRRWCLTSIPSARVVPRQTGLPHVTVVLPGSVKAGRTSTLPSRLLEELPHSSGRHGSAHIELRKAKSIMSVTDQNSEQHATWQERNLGSEPRYGKKGPTDRAYQPGSWQERNLGPFSASASLRPRRKLRREQTDENSHRWDNEGGAG